MTTRVKKLGPTTTQGKARFPHKPEPVCALQILLVGEESTTISFSSLAGRKKKKKRKNAIVIL